MKYVEQKLIWWFIGIYLNKEIDCIINCSKIYTELKAKKTSLMNFKIKYIFIVF